jgi:perosamine synthetase
VIRLTIPSIDEDDLRAVREALATGYLIQGARVSAFEATVAKLVRARYGVAVSNCTCALHLGLSSLDVKPGDICILPAYSWVATANAVQLCGARPEFVDIEPRTFNIDVNRVADTLARLMKDKTTAGKVRAVLPVHTFGQMAAMPEISRLCKEWNLAVIEDAACALGATFASKHPGENSLMACFSFHPRKAITTGEGGMITTNNDKIARKLRALRNHGADPESMEPDFVLPGHNYRMTEFQAALGSSQMNKLDRIISARRQAAARYDVLLEGTELEKPMVLPESKHVFQSYVVLPK